MDQIVERAEKARPIQQEPIKAVLALDANGRPRPNRRRVWFSAMALLLAAGALGAGYFYWTRPAVQTVYRTVPVERGAMTVEVSATGTLEPLTQVEISSELSGVMRTVLVDANQQVSAGEVLAVLDTTRIEAQIERARANVLAADARVTDAEVTLAESEQTLMRTQSLATRGMAAQQALDTARAARDRADSAVAVARANLAVAEAELKLQQADLEKSSIYTPIDGVVLSRDVNPGQTVASSMQAPVLFVIAENLERMELKAAIDEADIGTVAAGQNARFTVDAFPERRFAASISDISYASVLTDNVVTYEARLTVANEELLLRPGMTATVEIVTREADDILTVPAAAFRYSPPQESAGSGFGLQSLFMPRRMGPPMRSGGRARGGGEEGRPLYVLRDGQPQMVRVVTGATDGARMEVLSGLSEGDLVIVGSGQP